MKERPIIFSSEMVRAILEGRKTQMMRPIEPQPKYTRSIIQSILRNSEWSLSGTMGFIKCPYGKVWDRLWVKETFAIIPTIRNSILYKASLKGAINIDNLKWKTSTHMPRWASRITLEITNIRVERVQDIGEDDCYKEGFEHTLTRELETISINARTKFEDCWNSRYGKKYPWESNPWVWVIEFKKEK